MNTATLSLLAYIIEFSAWVFGLATSIFTFWAVVQNEKHEKTKEWFRIKWNALSATSWRMIHRKAIKWFLYFDKYLLKLINSLPHELHQTTFNAISAVVPLILIPEVYIFWGNMPALISTFLILPLFSYSFVSFLCGIRLLTYETRDKIVHLVAPLNLFLSSKIMFTLQKVAFLLIIILTTLLILKMNIWLSTLCMLFLFPLLWHHFGLISFPFPVSSLTDQEMEKRILFTFALSLSFTITMLFILLGHICEPNDRIPQVSQLLMSNVIFDGLTVTVTFLILEKAINSHHFIAIPLAVLVDVAIAAIFACLSLYLGLWGIEEYALTVQETFYVLMAVNSEGSPWKFGPYFWAMHTTFLPTLIYLTIIIVGLLAKSILEPVRWFLGLAQINKNPLAITATLFGIISTGLGFVAFLLNLAKT